MIFPLISVLMPVYKEPINQIRNSTESILAQDYKNIELIIIVDDPNNIEAVRYLQKVAKDNSQVKVQINNENIGIVESLNEALKLSKGEYIARMDADDISVKNRISLEINFLMKKKLDLVASNVQSISPNGEILYGKVTNYPLKDKYIKRYLEYYNCMPHPTWLAKRIIFANLKGYRNIPACEDYDFLIRGAISNYSYGLISRSLLYYRESQNSISKSNTYLQKLTSKFIREKYKSGEEYTLNDIQEFLHTKLKTIPESSSLKQKLLIHTNNNVVNACLLFSQIKGKILRELIMKEEKVRE